VGFSIAFYETLKNIEDGDRGARLPPRSNGTEIALPPTSLQQSFLSPTHFAPPLTSIYDQPHSTTHWDFADGYSISIQMLEFLFWDLTEIATQSIGEIPDQDYSI
jgi:hypothetical protein